MNGILSFAFDTVLMGLLIAGIVYATKLSKQLAGLRASRADMERFVIEFSSTVHRAEAGINGLKQAARAGGDDLERQIEKAQTLRDELNFLIESADQIATRISDTAARATRASALEQSQQSSLSATVTVLPAAKTQQESKPSHVQKPVTATENKPSAIRGAQSAAEAELLRALEKLG